MDYEVGVYIHLGMLIMLTLHAKRERQILSIQWYITERLCTSSSVGLDVIREISRVLNGYLFNGSQRISINEEPDIPLYRPNDLGSRRIRCWPDWT